MLIQRISLSDFEMCISDYIFRLIGMISVYLSKGFDTLAHNKPRINSAFERL
jgi:hypothetical protein